ncbi:MAG: hypothetical protein K2L42_00240 [Clostridia bacterium]|nr:hypothetical protein [Clostridia bacterium]
MYKLLSLYVNKHRYISSKHNTRTRVKQVVRDGAVLPLKNIRLIRARDTKTKILIISLEKKLLPRPFISAFYPCCITNCANRQRKHLFYILKTTEILNKA